MPAAAAQRPKNRTRFRGAMLAGGVAALLGIAAGLSPDRRGYGTHQQLGQPACRTLVETGYPCPACGMTTCFAAMAEGKFALAARAQPFGVLLFGLVAAAGLAGLAEALTGRDVLGRLRPRLWWLWLGLGLWGAGWGLKVLLGLADRTYPLGGG